MKNSKRIIITIFILFFLDFILTLYFLSNSSHADEGNPLINIYSGYIILAINLAYFIIVIFLSKIIEKYETVVLKSKGTFEYVKKIYLSNHFSFIFVSLAFAFVNASIVSRTIVVVDWIVFGIFENTFYSTSYSKLRTLMPFGRYDILLGVLSFLICIFIWFRLEHKKSTQCLSVGNVETSR